MICSLFLLFISLTMVSLDVSFLYLFCSVFTELLTSMGRCLLSILECLWPLSIKNVFLAPSVSGTVNTYTLDQLILSQQHLSFNPLSPLLMFPFEYFLLMNLQVLSFFPLCLSSLLLCQIKLIFHF